LPTAKGTGFYLSQCVPEYGPDGAVANVLVVSRDLTERKRAEEELWKAKEQLRQHANDLEKIVASRTAKLHETIAELEHFSYAIVHDMRAPLRAMQGFASMLEEECADCQRPLSKEYFRRIKTASRRMDQLIADCLSYSKAANQELALEPVDLFQLIDGLVQTYPNLQPDKADIQIEPALPTVLGNEAALTQCFSNLLDNAVKFAKPGTKPQIRVWAESVHSPPSTVQSLELEAGPWPAVRSPASGGEVGESASSVRIWIEDNGIGIPKPAQQRIFGMFQRATADHEGTGLGLAIVRKVVERMGGRVGVESVPGQGSRFWVELKPVVL
jgi:signal transduction histidine kinase